MAGWDRVECRICGIKRRNQIQDRAGSMAQVMDRYLRGDQGERLNLWLSYRDLRHEFTLLELDRT